MTKLRWTRGGIVAVIAALVFAVLLIYGLQQISAPREVDLSTGRVDIAHTINDTRGEVAFSKCLLAVRQWRLIERNPACRAMLRRMRGAAALLPLPLALCRWSMSRIPNREVSPRSIRVRIE